MSDATSAGSYGLSLTKTGATVSAPTLSYLPPRPRHCRPKLALTGCGGISDYHLRTKSPMGLGPMRSARQADPIQSNADIESSR